ncbi:putative type II secretion system protein F [Rubripirellula obstinata]|uniref:Putative type II secretion system protein F n=2 Tax=Rubripirellula obstinata TaxID=406547 RepID=A0A5B1CP65_9BACT|nr:putative type II secretion system protein F [Rubripirellula obstinata]
MGLKAAAKFSHRFATSHKAGVDMVRLLETEAKAGPGHQRIAMQRLADEAKAGNQIHEAMEKQRPYFPVLLTAMTAVGEETGKLDRAMFILAGHLQQRLDTRNKFISSITFPMLQLAAGVGVLSLVIYIMGVMSPAGGGQMADILGLGLRGGSGVLWLWLYVGIFVGSIALVVWAFVRNVAGLQNLAPILYMIPKLGPAIQTITISRFCWTMALSLDAGLDPIRSIALSLDSTGSDYYRSGSDNARDAIKSGATLANGLKATSVFPEDFIARVDIAEHSGTDAESMEYLAKEYDERAKAAVKFMSGLATVVIRVTVALFLLFFIFRIFGMYLGAINDASKPI